MRSLRPCSAYAQGIDPYGNVVGPEAEGKARINSVVSLLASNFKSG